MGEGFENGGKGRKRKLATEGRYTACMQYGEQGGIGRLLRLSRLFAGNQDFASFANFVRSQVSLLGSNKGDERAALLKSAVCAQLFVRFRSFSSNVSRSSNAIFELIRTGQREE